MNLYEIYVTTTPLPNPRHVVQNLYTFFFEASYLFDSNIIHIKDIGKY